MNEASVTAKPSQEVMTALKRELQQGEELIWNGVPDSRTFERVQKGARMFAWLFLGISIFTVIAAGVMSLVTHNKYMGIFVGVGSIPTLIIAIGIVVKVNGSLRKRAANTIYGLTSLRAIVIEGAMWNDSRSIYSYKAEQLGKMSKKEFPDGTGDLVFEEVSAGYSQNRQPVLRPRGFLGISDVHRIEGLVKETLGVG